MLHPFTPSLTDAGRCARCKYDEISHTNRATCECCSNSGNMEIFSGMLMCEECIQKERNLQAENTTEEKQKERINNHNNAILNHSRSIDLGASYREDMFNLPTVPTIELFAAIDSDTSIVNKQFEKCKVLKERVEQFTKVIFSARSVLSEATNRQKQAQIELNIQANALRAEERTRLGLVDINYTPTTPKTAKPKVSKPSSKKWTKADVYEAAKKYNVDAAIVQMMCVARNMHPEDAAMMHVKNMQKMSGE